MKPRNVNARNRAILNDINYHYDHKMMEQGVDFRIEDPASVLVFYWNVNFSAVHRYLSHSSLWLLRPKNKTLSALHFDAIHSFYPFLIVSRLFLIIRIYLLLFVKYIYIYFFFPRHSVFLFNIRFIYLLYFNCVKIIRVFFFNDEELLSCDRILSNKFRVLWN